MQAIRKRVKRGTLESDKEKAGRVYVYLDAVLDAVEDEAPNPHNDALISEMRDQIQYLREENRRKDEIIMQQAITMRQLSAPESPQTDAEASGEGDVSERYSESGESREKQKRSWWRRLFGG